jgi:hypothetical protein
MGDGGWGVVNTVGVADGEQEQEYRVNQTNLAMRQSLFGDGYGNRIGTKGRFVPGKKKVDSLFRTKSLFAGSMTFRIQPRGDKGSYPLQNVWKRWGMLLE